MHALLKTMGARLHIYFSPGHPLQVWYVVSSDTDILVKFCPSDRQLRALVGEIARIERRAKFFVVNTYGDMASSIGETLIDNGRRVTFIEYHDAMKIFKSINS